MQKYFIIHLRDYEGFLFRTNLKLKKAQVAKVYKNMAMVLAIYMLKARVYLWH